MYRYACAQLGAEKPKLEGNTTETAAIEIFTDRTQTNSIYQCNECTVYRGHQFYCV